MSPRVSAPIRGTCYGYEVRSELEFDYLRGGTGDPLNIEVGADDIPAPGKVLREWRPPRFPTYARLHEDRGGYRLWVEGAGWFGVSPDESRVSVPSEGDRLRMEERIWGIPILLCFLARGDVPLHASAVEVGGRALLLAAPSRFGKTTLAAAFASRGYRVLSEDLSCVRPEPVPSLIPGPAMLRVRRDVAESVRIDGVREVGRDDDRVHLSICSRRGSCAPVPVAGVALLNEVDRDPHVERMGEAAAVRNLWAVSFNLPTAEDRARAFRAVADLASSIETWRMDRRMRIEDLPATVDCLVEAVGDDG